jgi:hypothetical protein
MVYLDRVQVECWCIFRPSFAAMRQSPCQLRNT